MPIVKRRFVEPASKVTCFLFENQNINNCDISCRAVAVSSFLCSEILGREWLRRRLPEKLPCSVLHPTNASNLSGLHPEPGPFSCSHM